MEHVTWCRLPAANRGSGSRSATVPSCVRVAEAPVLCRDARVPWAREQPDLCAALREGRWCETITWSHSLAGGENGEFLAGTGEVGSFQLGTLLLVCASALSFTFFSL